MGQKGRLCHGLLSVISYQNGASFVFTEIENRGRCIEIYGTGPRSPAQGWELDESLSLHSGSSFLICKGGRWHFNLVGCSSSRRWGRSHRRSRIQFRLLKCPRCDNACRSWQKR